MILESQSSATIRFFDDSSPLKSKEMNVNYIARKKAFFLPPLHPVKEIEKLPSRPSSANEIPNQSRTEDIEDIYYIIKSSSPYA